MSERRKRQPLTEEQKAHLSKIWKERLADPEAKVERAKRLKRDDPEIKQKCLENRIKAQQDEAYRQNRSEITKRLWADSESRAKLMEYFHSQEYSDLRSANMVERWSKLSLEERNAILAPRRAKALKDRTSKLEARVKKALEVLEVEHEAQYIIGGCCVDFYLPSKNLVLEVNGCYWHGCQECGWDEPWHTERRNEDRRRVYFLLGRGYRVHVLWEHELK